MKVNYISGAEAVSKALVENGVENSHLLAGRHARQCGSELVDRRCERLDVLVAVHERQPESVELSLSF